MSAPKIQFDTRRSVAEWIGATPDSIPPDHVKLRIFERHKGVCHISRRKIMGGEPWDVEHVVPLRDGHRELRARRREPREGETPRPRQAQKTVPEADQSVGLATVNSSKPQPERPEK